MKEYLVNKNEEGLTLHKYLMRRLPNAAASLLYKQLRKKNINLNKKKADGNERLQEGDKIQVFFADETIAKFEGTVENTAVNPLPETKPAADMAALDILYEDEDILAIDKPAGMLTQKAAPEDISLNELMISYLLSKGSISEASLKIVKPSVCNRLDRNTSGIVLCGKTMKGLQYLSDILKKRDVHKYYYTLVKGKLLQGGRYEGYLTKSAKNNQVKITDKKLSAESQYIVTSYKSVRSFEALGVKLTLLEVLLETGRAHQIRAHLASLGYPVIGDPKYGDAGINKKFGKAYNIKRQLLHAARVEFPDGNIIKSPLPEDMKWLPGNPEA